MTWWMQQHSPQLKDESAGESELLAGSAQSPSDQGPRDAAALRLNCYLFYSLLRRCYLGYKHKTREFRMCACEQALSPSDAVAWKRGQTRIKNKTSGQTAGYRRRALPVRKLRELLYDVEMEQTLGMARKH
ncbi:hypothetical protein [Rhodoferax sp. BLA1]|uniref:hypothetical protein n=1 Tax=Rhodoferax sp. BLA1 TaxID=2576062 RepID=UPI0015D40823|nr:hypothetical protein [Rhodoferax sp. BLA1]